MGENIEEKLQRQVREARRTEMTKAEVSKTDASTKMYAQFGKCFIQQEKAALETSLEAATEKYRGQIKKLKDSETYFNRQRDETAGNLNDMLQNLREMHEKGEA